jgi:hypothetical protein
MSWLTGIVKALLEAALGFLGQRLDRARADNAQREAGARETEARDHDRFAEQARAAADIRSRAGGNDAELDDFLRAPGDRGQRRAD